MADKQSTKELSETLGSLSLNGKPTVAESSRKLGPHHKAAPVPKPPPPTPATPAAKDPIKTLVADSWEEEEEEIAAAEDQSGPATGTATGPQKEQESMPATTPRAMDISKAPHRKHADKLAAARNAPDITAASTAVKNAPVADSWEDEATSDNEPVAQPEEKTLPRANGVYKAPHQKLRSSPAPPTSASPARSATPPSRTGTPSSDRRPETTTAVANRLIAGALGVKMPRRTEEQRAYDKAVREQEKKRRDQEREAKKRADEETARAKAAMWDD